MGRATPPPSSVGFRAWGKSLLIALVLFLALRTLVVQTFVIVSESMRETLTASPCITSSPAVPSRS